MPIPVPARSRHRCGLLLQHASRGEQLARFGASGQVIADGGIVQTGIGGGQHSDRPGIPDAQSSAWPWPAAGARFVSSRGAAGHRWSRGPWGGPRYLVDLQGAFLEAQGRTQLDIK